MRLLLAFVMGAAIAVGASATVRAQDANRIQLGVNASLGGFRPFPADDAWNTDISATPVDPRSDALQRYGMILTDNGGDWFISGAPDPRWNDEEIRTMKQLRGSDLEVVRMGPATEG